MHVKTVEERFNSKYEAVPFSGCWIWTAASWANGRYGCFGYEGKMQTAHRVSYRLHVGEIPEGLVVCHRCDIPLCVNPSHLFLGSVSDNAKDMISKGRQTVHLQKLSEREVLEATKLRRDGWMVKDLATKFGISRSHMSRVTRGYRTYYNPE